MFVGFDEGHALDCSYPSGLACCASMVGHLTSSLVTARTLAWVAGFLEEVITGYSSGRVRSQVHFVRLN